MSSSSSVSQGTPSWDVESLELLAIKAQTLLCEIEEREKQLKVLKTDIVSAKFENQVRADYRLGRADCDDPRHFEQYKKPGEQFSRTRLRSLQLIFDRMAPYSEAKCSCERAALAYKQGRQPSGTLANQWVCQGATKKGFGPVPGPNTQVKKVLRLNYQLNEHQVKYLHGLCPGWLFYTDTTCGHDHPIAHTLTSLASRALVEELLPVTRDREAPLDVLDLHGSPTANERNEHHHNIKFTTVCKVITPDDELRRVTKWGPKVGDDDLRWHDLFDREIGAEGSTIGPDRLSKFDALMSIHTLYYYSKDEIMRLMNRCNRDAVMHGICHRFNGESGSFNDGEQTWTKFKVGGQTWVRQVNKLTGKTYEHPDNSWMFETTSYGNNGSGLVWDMNLVFPDTYRFKIKSCRYDIVPPSNRADFVMPEANRDEPPTYTQPPERLETNSTAWLQRYETCVIEQAEGKWIEMPMPSRLHPLFNEARRRLDTKPRTMEQFASHSALLETKIKRFEKESRTTVTVEEATALKVGAFWCDAKDSLHRDLELFATHWQESRLGDGLYKYGHHGAERAVASALLDAVATGNVNSLRGVAGIAKALLASKT